MKVVLTIVSIVILGCASKKLPASFKICDHFGPNVDVCLKEAIASALVQLKNGLPEVDAPSLSPLHISNITVHKFGNELSFLNVNIDNIWEMTITYLSSNLTRESFWMSFNMSGDHIGATMDYSMKGKLLFFTVNGGGKGELTMKNVVVQANLKGGVAEGGKHYKLDTFNIKLYPRLVTYNMENIVPGQKEISDQINDVLNETWTALWEEIQLDLEEILDEVFLNYTNNILKYVPV
ncbi:hypothetical protein RI129_012472 [Pyrocoelia pectoralis]|uniref:Uncharacterized protein n=1 Tax=Pyrocoelia pectoralis TaxID=417401 RepID=A0AAN7ZC46_9COLE